MIFFKELNCYKNGSSGACPFPAGYASQTGLSASGQLCWGEFQGHVAAFCGILWNEEGLCGLLTETSTPRLRTHKFRNIALLLRYFAVVSSAPDEFGYLLSVVSSIAEGNLIGLGPFQIKVGVMLPCHAYGAQNLNAIGCNTHVGF